MVAAILSMAGHLGVQTLAEGVETQTVGPCSRRWACGHVQGFICPGRCVDKTTAWATGHRRDPACGPAIERRAG